MQNSIFTIILKKKKLTLPIVPRKRMLITQKITYSRNQYYQKYFSINI